jgi:hypothetical protein
MARAVAASSPTTRSEIVAFRPEHLDVVARFSAKVWARPRSAAYLRWRYLEHPDHHAYLVLRGDECLALVSAFRRPYQVGERRLRISDSFDWFCLPELRRSGLGVRVMQRMMQDPEPVIVTGGSADTRDLLPRMRFSVPATVKRYALLLDAERTADALARRTRLPRALGRAVHALGRPFLAPRVRGAPPGARVETPETLDEATLALDPRPGGRGSAPVWTPPYLAWLRAGAPAFGRYLPLCFRIGEALAGWALLRVYDGARGREAALLDVRAKEPSAALYAWLVSEAAVFAARLGPGLLSAGTSCPLVEAGLRANRFRPIGDGPIHYWAKDGAPLEAPVVFGQHWGDETLVPYPAEWPER